MPVVDDEKSLLKEEARLSDEVQKAGMAHDWDKMRELSDERYEVHRRLAKFVRARYKKENEAAAKRPPKFVIWKQYGFRHIVATEDQRQVRAICGNSSWGPTSDLPTGSDRPLCGLCRNAWKRLTGETLQ